MEKFSATVLKLRWFIIVFVSAATLFLAFQIPSVKINSDVVSSLPDTDKDAVLLKKIGTTFGGNQTGMIIIVTDNIFRPDVLRHVVQLTDTISAIKGISSITSLANALDIKTDETGLEIGKLIDPENIPETDSALAALREKILSGDTYKGTIVSEDGTSTVIVFVLDETSDMQLMAHTVEEKTASLKLPEKIYFAGSPMLVTSIAGMISDDLATLLPVALILILIVLYLGFRSMRGVILPILTAVISIVWVIGIMALTGSEMSMVSNNIPIVLLAIGTAYAIHVLNRIDQVRGELNNAIIVALTYVTIPVILAALTTIGGFLSFIFGSYLKMIRDFGIYTALGTVISLVLSIVFVPALISALSWKNRVRTEEEIESETTFFSKYLHRPLHSLLFNHTKRVLFSWIIITLLSIGGIFLVKRNVDIRNYFRKNDPTRIAEDIMTSKFGGSKPVFVLFRGDIQDPAVLKTMLAASDYMIKSPGVTATQSVAQLIARLNFALGGELKIPDESEKIEQLWFLLDGNENMKSLVREDMSEALIISKFLSPENKERRAFARYMDTFIREHSTKDCTIEITGMPFIEMTMDQSLIISQSGSLIIAVLFVILIVSIILRSFLSGIYAAVPIILTVLILFGVMGYTGIPLNIATVLVASIAMGIGIDYSIHVITHFNTHLREGASLSDALDETIKVSGKAVIINVISVSAGFLVLLFSEMVPLQYFGLLISLSMVGSGLSALTFLPAILLFANRNRAARSPE